MGRFTQRFDNLAIHRTDTIAAFCAVMLLAGNSVGQDPTVNETLNYIGANPTYLCQNQPQSIAGIISCPNGSCQVNCLSPGTGGSQPDSPQPWIVAGGAPGAGGSSSGGYFSGGRPGVHSGHLSYVASAVDNWTMSYIHSAVDYGLPDMNRGSGCVPCQSGSGNVLRNPYSEIIVERFHRFRDLGQIGSFGPGVFCNYDIKLHLISEADLTTTGTLTNVIDLFDPTRFYPVRMSEVSGQTGTFYDSLGKSHTELKLYDDQDQLTSDFSLAEEAVYVTLHGQKFIFEIVEITGLYTGSGSAPDDQYIGTEDASSFETYEGRLTRIEDRNGYGVTISYVYDETTNTPPTAPDELWKIDEVTSDHGEVAEFSYQTSQVGGMWAVSQIDLPNQQSVTYSYASDKLSSVTHPDSTTSSVTYTTITTPSLVKVNFADAAAGGTHRNKYLYASATAGSYPGEDDYFLNSASMLLRIAVNSEDEVLYFNAPGDSIQQSDSVNVFLGSVSYS